MLVKELRTKNVEQLTSLIDDLKAQLFMLRFQNSTGQLDQPHKISAVKKDIAKVFTIIGEKTNNKSSKKVATKQVAKKEAVAKPVVKTEAKAPVKETEVKGETK